MDLLPPKKESPQPDEKIRVTHAQWELTPEAFAKLLAAFSPDEKEAGRLYLSLHLKLVRLFEWNACRDAEHLVDVTFNRVARKLCEGQIIDNAIGFSLGVAHMVIKEARKQQERLSLLPEDANIPAEDPAGDDHLRELTLKCLDKCLAELAPESRALILEYYCQETKAKEIRRKLASRLGIPLNALRIRALRVREKLEKCVVVCMASAA